jgi:hypothetical protein
MEILNVFQKDLLKEFFLQRPTTKARQFSFPQKQYLFCELKV